jgi:uncharacterized membrane protein
MHDLITLAANPLNGVSTKIIAIIMSVAAIAVAWAAFKVLARSGQGNVKRDMNVGGSVAVGIVLLVVALGLAGFVGFISGIISFTGISGS